MKPEPEITHYLKDDRLFFVNRDLALEQLHDVHRSKFNRAKAQGVGRDWRFPLIDNVFGLGKTEFARNYIQKSRELWPENQRDEFQKHLCASRTIMIKFEKNVLIKEDGNNQMQIAHMKAVTFKYVIDALSEFFVKKPNVFDPQENVSDFLKRFTETYGPLFIVLDEIGLAFENSELNDTEKREKFMLYCSDVLQSWLDIKNVSFLLVGRATFFSHVALRPDDSVLIKASPVKFQRLNIHLLRPEAIDTILRKTRMDTESLETISQRFNMNDDQIKKATEHLFCLSSGHPRTITDILRSCHSFSDIMNHKEDFKIRQSKEFHKTLFYYIEAVKYLIERMENGSEVDLTQSPKEGKATYDLIASNSLIGWHGTLKRAQLFAHPDLKNIIYDMILPCKEYIIYVGKAIPRVSLNFPNVLEWMFLKRFQELFLTNGNPKKVLPNFFDTKIFGSLNEIRFTIKTQQMPQVTSGGSDYVDMEDLTMKPEDYKKLIRDLDDQFQNGICLKARPQSASSDAFLLTRAEHNDDFVRLTVGLAIKNYKSTGFSKRQLKEECEKFNRMFTGTNIKKRRNILFICCTKYQDSLLKQFNGKLFWAQEKNDEFPNIHEVILLNMTTEANRRLFFDISEDLSKVINDVIEKGESELESFESA